MEGCRSRISETVGSLRPDRSGGTYGLSNARTCLEVVELTDYPTPEHASFKEEEEIKRKEGQEILSKLKPNDFCILLDLGQKQPDSLEMAVYLEKWMRQSGASLTFVIGGSLGLSEEVRQRGNAVLTLSHLTLTHQMTRVFLWEILYRSFKIAHHEPYHK